MTQLALDLERPADLPGRLRAAGLPPALTLVLHRNRRVMLSFDGCGALRVHEGYAQAPDDIIRAIVAWARPGLRRAARLDLARVFLTFSVHGNQPPPRRKRPEPPVAGDDTKLLQLRALHHELNARWFDGRLTPVALELSGRMKRKLGHYEPRSSGGPAIAISRRHLKRHGWGSVAETLLHEMVHQWQDETGLAVDHGPLFRRKAKAVGIDPRAVVRLG